MSLQQSPTTDIPLRCVICPKAPYFSDLSHLLTHLASKSHLSYLNKAEIKDEPETNSRLQQYRVWYNQYNLKELLAMRLGKKESKQSTSRPAAQSTSRRREAKRDREEESEYQPTQQVVEQPASEQSIAPLGYPHGYQNAYHGGSYGGYHGGYQGGYQDAYYIVQESMSQPAGYVSAQPPWAPSPDQGHVIPASSPFGKEEDQDSKSSGINGLASSGYSLRQRNAVRAVDSSDDAHGAMEDTIVDKAKLKGVFWKGMAMFDSATADMKRKRNQKKQYSVADQLKASSEVIQRVEMVFDGNWQHRKTRTITGQPEEDHDRLKGEETPEPEEPSEKKVVRRRRQPLASREVNTGRIKRRSAQKATQHAKHQTRASQHDSCFDEAMADDQLTYGTVVPQNTGSFTVHRDPTDGNAAFRPTVPTGYMHAPSPLYNTGMVNPLEGYQTNPQAMTGHTYGYSYPRHSALDSMSYGSANDILSMYTHGMSSFGQINFPGQPMMASNPLFSGHGHNSYPTYQPSGFESHLGQSQAYYGQGAEMYHDQGDVA